MNGEKRIRGSFESFSGNFIDFESLLTDDDLSKSADVIRNFSSAADGEKGIDAVDRFIDFVYFKIRTGYWDNFNDAYPVKRMNDEIMEKNVVSMINEHLYPDIVPKLLKFIARNIYEPDSDLFIANLIFSKNIIRSFYETYILFKKDIGVTDVEQRTANVRRIQEFSGISDPKLSSPLDAAARLKYVLEFFFLSGRSYDMFSMEDIYLSSDSRPVPEYREEERKKRKLI